MKSHHVLERHPVVLLDVGEDLVYHGKARRLEFFILRNKEKGERERGGEGKGVETETGIVNVSSRN